MSRGVQLQAAAVAAAQALLDGVVEAKRLEDLFDNHQQCIGCSRPSYRLPLVARRGPGGTRRALFDVTRADSHPVEGRASSRSLAGSAAACLRPCRSQMMSSARRNRLAPAVAPTIATNGARKPKLGCPSR